MPTHPPAQVAADQLPLQRLAHWARTTPDRVALVQPMGQGQVQQITWAQAADQAARVAAWLRDHQGVGPGDRVALLGKNSAHWIICDWAIWLAGGVSVPLYPTLAAGTVAQILAHSGARVLAIGKLDGWEGMKAGVPSGLPCLALPLAPADAEQGAARWDTVLATTAPLAAWPERAGDELSSILYTSGTTGQPKGVMHSFANFMAAVQTGLTRFPLSAQSRLLSYLPLSHVVERVLVEHAQLSTGFQVYFAESLDSFTADLQRARPTVFFSVPRLWVKFEQGVLQRMPQRKLDLLLKLPLVGGLVRRRILSALGLDQCIFAVGGAAPMPAELLHWYARLGLRIAEGYGMTENLGASHLTSGDPAEYGTVGRPYDGVECRIDPTSGEVQMRAAWLMLGYYREPVLTGEALGDDGWLRTGDKGQLDAQGRLRITGRVKDLFKTSKGKYVSPAPIEDRLAAHEAVEACCVAGANLAQPLALLMLNAAAMQQAATAAGRAVLDTSLAAHLHAVNAHLDPHERLDTLVVTAEPWTVDNDLVTPTFKVKRNQIDDRYAAKYAAWCAQRQPVVWA